MPNTTHTQQVIINSTLYTVDYVATQTDDITYHDITFTIVHPFTGVSRELQVCCLLYATEYTSGVDTVELPLHVMFDKYHSVHDGTQRFYHKLFCARLIRAYHNGDNLTVLHLV